MEYRRDIDGLRALAIIPVVLFHAGANWLPGGFLGVDIFFVISGFLISSILISECETGKFSLVQFYERRARRILPMLFSVMIVVYVLAWYGVWTKEAEEISSSIKYVTLFAGNFFALAAGDYFGPVLEEMPMIHAWSLGVEEQFYIVFPWFLYAIWRFPKKWVFLLVFLVGLLSFAAAQLDWLADSQASFYLLPSRAWELFAGVLAALGIKYFRWQLSDESSAGLSLLGLLLVLSSFFLVTGEAHHPGWITLLPVVGSVLMIVCSAGKAKDLLSSRAMVGVGLLSYSIYLWHQPVFAFYKKFKMIEQASFFEACGLIVLVFVLSLLSLKFIEAPFRNRNLFGRKAIFSFSLAGMVVFLLLGHVGDKRSVWINRLLDHRADMHKLEIRLAQNYGLNGQCRDFNVSKDCQTDSEPTILVWGDSYAQHIVTGILNSDSPVHLKQMTRPGCASLLGVAFSSKQAKRTEQSTQDCVAFNQKVIEWLATQQNIKYVVLASAMSGFFSPSSALLGKADSRDAYVKTALERTLGEIRRLGKVPVIIAQPPSNGQDLGKCLARQQLLNSGVSCDFPESAMTTEIQAVYAVLRELQTEGNVIWLKDALCLGGICHASYGDVLYYSDVGHLTHEGSRNLGDRLKLASKIFDSK